MYQKGKSIFKGTCIFLWIPTQGLALQDQQRPGWYVVACSVDRGSVLNNGQFMNRRGESRSRNIGHVRLHLLKCLTHWILAWSVGHEFTCTAFCSRLEGMGWTYDRALACCSSVQHTVQHMMSREGLGRQPGTLSVRIQSPLGFEPLRTAVSHPSEWLLIIQGGEGLC